MSETPKIESPEQLAEYIKARILDGVPMDANERQSWELYCKTKGWLVNLKNIKEASEEQDATAIKRALKRSKERARNVGEALTEHEQGKWSS